MPKHIHREQYLKNPLQLVPPVTIYPNIQDRNDNASGHHMLPAVFNVKKGERVTINYPGPGVAFVSEGELEYEDMKNPGPRVIIGAGGVVHLESGEILRWCSPSEGKGIAIFWVPVSVKNFESFIVPE